MTRGNREMGTMYAWRALRRRGLLVAAAGAAIALGPTSTASAATLQVSSNADSGPGSLRATIAAAAPYDLIVIAPGVDPELTSGPLVVDKPLTIKGQGAKSTVIVGSSENRVFEVGPNSSVPVTIADMEITNGRAPDGAAGSDECGGDGCLTAGQEGGNGGLILNRANLTLTRTYLSGGRAGDGGASGDSYFDFSTSFPARQGLTGGRGGSGGAVASSGALTIRDSTLLGNEAGAGGRGGTGRGGAAGGAGGAGGDGGAVAVLAGSAVVTNSTIQFNSAGGGGTGASQGADTGRGRGGDGGGGGAIHLAGGSAAVTHATVSANASGTGGAAGTGETTVQSSLPGTGGGAKRTAGTLSVTNSIIAGNSQGGSGSGATSNCAGAVADGGFNITHPASTGCPGEAGDPLLLGGTGYWGGPTPTAEIGFASPAKDLIPVSNPGCEGRDQRGVTRPQGFGCDAGAFERDDTAPIVTVTGGPAEGASTRSRRPSFSFSSDDAGSTFACRFDSGAFEPCDSGRFAPGTNLPDGPHVFEVTATNIGGDAGDAPAVRRFTIDTVAPQTRFRSAPKRIRPGGSARFIAAASEPGSSFRCSIDSKPFRRCKASIVLKAKRLKPGRHRLRVRAVDRAGNVDRAPAAAAFRVLGRPR